MFEERKTWRENRMSENKCEILPRLMEGITPPTIKYTKLLPTSIIWLIQLSCFQAPHSYSLGDVERDRPLGWWVQSIIDLFRTLNCSFACEFGLANSIFWKVSCGGLYIVRWSFSIRHSFVSLCVLAWGISHTSFYLSIDKRFLNLNLSSW